MRKINQPITRARLARARLMARSRYRTDGLNKFDPDKLDPEARALYEQLDEERKKAFAENWENLTMDGERELNPPPMVPQPEKAARNLKGMVLMAQTALIDDFPFVSFAQQFYVFSAEYEDQSGYVGMTTQFDDDFYAIGISERVLSLEYGANEAVLVLLHELAHIIHHEGGTDTHTKEFEELLDAMIFKFNEVHGMNIENDYRNATP